jgi:ribosomal-protein-alanine N-acetyltransferase
MPPGQGRDQQRVHDGSHAEVIRIAFDGMGLHRIEANIIPRNVRSRRVVEKLGFTLEGMSRKYLRINGVWEDHLHYALLNEKI